MVRNSAKGSVTADSWHETRIKQFQKQPLDLIAEYRNTINERYALKMSISNNTNKESSIDVKRNENNGALNSNKAKDNMSLSFSY